jgi:trigger factor
MAYNQMRGQAERDVRGAMLLEKIAEQEDVNVSEEEITEEIQKMARNYRVTPEDIRASMAQQGGEDGIANSLRTRKAVEALMKNAKITDGEWIDESQSQVAEETSDETEGKSKKETKETKKKKEEAKESKPKAEKKKVEEKKPKKKSAKTAKES